ncbi:MAG: hypothetical protein WDA68_09175 [Phycisphaerae bacterium]
MGMRNIYNNAGNGELIKKLKTQLVELKKQYGDEDDNFPEMKEVVDKYY